LATAMLVEAPFWLLAKNNKNHQIFLIALQNHLHFSFATLSILACSFSEWNMTKNVTLLPW
jgi:hypothetical protein